MDTCPICGNSARWGRRVSWGTTAAVLATAGLWTLALPFYKVRCKACGATRNEAAQKLWFLADSIQPPPRFFRSRPILP